MRCVDCLLVGMDVSGMSRQRPLLSCSFSDCGHIELCVTKQASRPVKYLGTRYTNAGNTVYDCVLVAI